MTDPSKKSLTVVGTLQVQLTGGRISQDDEGWWRVLITVPAEPDESMKSVVASAGDLYEFFNQIGADPTPFIMTIGGDKDA
jgi:hypothetical protein